VAPDQRVQVPAFVDRQFNIGRFWATHLGLLVSSSALRLDCSDRYYTRGVFGPSCTRRWSLCLL
jgi:hypothetical protein